jgi:hypothetical protein
MVLFYLVVVSVPLLAKITGSHIPGWLVCCSIIIIIWTIFNIVLREVFIKIEGKGIAENKRDIISTLIEFYNNPDFQVDEEKIIRSFKPSYLPIWGRLITVFVGRKLHLSKHRKIGEIQLANRNTWFG